MAAADVWVPDISITLCDLRILVNQPTESIPPYDPPSRPGDNCFATPEWRLLSQGTVRTVQVVMVGELGQHRHRLLTPQDEHPIQHLPPHGAHPPLRVGVRPRRPHRRAQHLDPLRGEDRVEPDGELGIPIADQEPEPGNVLADLQEKVAGLLRTPPPDALSPEHMDPTGGHLNRKQHIQPPQQDRVHGEEVHRQHTGSLSS